jgi:hypothetical protein
MTPLYHRRTSDPALAPLLVLTSRSCAVCGMPAPAGIASSTCRSIGRQTYRSTASNLTRRAHAARSAGFEFFTTGKPIYTGTVTQEGLSMTSIKAACVNVQVTLEGDRVTWTAADPDRRSAASTAARSLADPAAVPGAARLTSPWTTRRLPPSLGRDEYHKLLFESWAPGTSHSGVHTTLHTQGRQTTNLHGDLGNQNNEIGALRGLRGSAGTNLTRDVQYDMPWAMSDGRQAVTYSLLNSETPAAHAGCHHSGRLAACARHPDRHRRDVRHARVRDLHRLVQSGQRDPHRPQPRAERHQPDGRARHT